MNDGSPALAKNPPVALPVHRADYSGLISLARVLRAIGGTTQVETSAILPACYPSLSSNRAIDVDHGRYDGLKKFQGPTGVQNSAILQVFRGSHCCKGNRINGT